MPQRRPWVRTPVLDLGGVRYELRANNGMQPTALGAIMTRRG
jgi:hypothetical protein